ncbi:hypothetical protein COCSUDRAFT_62899 [Coccomyxa subellipsoidea C-169]|uniref:Uncharacterized protein n=1 Tax=Coccomyxa subellipsoidea (strain C-169) TaxID=574566 RepID=I0YY92_COCSC|nr:hypothetical protein COCSUDRAFT_62899 [Coccomyxa subellipsoidea C-169]EIE23361.1 hypothetical protein COCSUDRAFT_62899 [Coccomyxa subellipsoidea C-169]|eukprot:XP_005647905.1 hypothetical protein COCSUDRAFT_62899 [Coccomyxa subellipsoidea C-169]
MKEDDKHAQPVHRHVEGLVQSGLHASIKEVLECLSSDEAIGVISKIVKAETTDGTRSAVHECLEGMLSMQGLDVIAHAAAVHALTLAETSSNPSCRAASRLTAKDIVLGSYDAVEEKQRELLTNPYVRCMLLPAGALLAFVFFVPLCLCLWRFALYGPGSFPCQ